MFPAGRSWLVSTRWDDDWTWIGGPGRLVHTSCATLTCGQGR